MKRLITVLFVLTVVGMFASEVFAWLSPFSKERITASGKHCVHGYYGNHGAVGTYYAGDASAFNEQLATLDNAKHELEFATKSVSKTVVLHPGSMVVPKYVEPNREISTDWLVQMWHGSDSGKQGWHVQIDLWLGGQIKLDELRIPEGFAVKSGREIEDFVERHKNNAR